MRKTRRPRALGRDTRGVTQGILAHTQALLAQILKFTAPADSVVSAYFRAEPKLGHRERGAIAESVFAVLRRKSEFSHDAESGQGPIERRLALLGLWATQGEDACAAHASPDERQWLAHVARIDPGSLAPRVRANLPEWIYARLVQKLGEDQAQQLAVALNRPAPLDCRVNLMKMDRDAALAALADSHIDAAPTRYAPHGIRLAGKPALQRLPLFEAGALEVQDEGSQLLCQLVAPRRGEMIVDFCAGAGGKTLALGAMMRSSGRLYAFDVSDKRLAKLKPRLARSGLSNVHPVLIDSENDAKIKRLAGKIDRVLVDAPCSGLGTLRRNPDLKWRQSPQAVEELIVKQASILASAARLVKPGGRLVYATCSLLDAENREIAEAFVASHDDFVPLAASEILESQKIPEAASLANGPYLELLPHRHATDGFFAAVFERKK
ncbi:RsmB/NOP family class I SAM-dependent RNA methyltransferase [Pandoraea sp.]|uniref:RsmB/NOP family class I SAM-dependent RNA methyltransferase n=1 Tax=Pandoraea sp. TaxID=1883445 RepID=UPI00120BC764|nr:RsmB/NOP family class I SAM-dependent RNA methyltransferase [Pandoraea sp.]TAL56536.1 MAG: RsmB/NOP family class I SAM-dependent RNA methyltransferase [Pandoraea sp.]TAM15357.1 MAG: RsmB/NOP family class I SAM-dependent RNA methyltransferase [Pandoraea sp.]